MTMFQLLRELISANQIVQKSNRTNVYSSFESIPYDYWQLTVDNYRFQCPYQDSCLGGFYHSNLTRFGPFNSTALNSSHLLYPMLPNQCEDGYFDFLCSKASAADTYISFISRKIEYCNIPLASNAIVWNMFHLTMFSFIVIAIIYLLFIFNYIGNTNLYEKYYKYLKKESRAIDEERANYRQAKLLRLSTRYDFNHLDLLQLQRYHEEMMNLSDEEDNFSEDEGNVADEDSSSDSDQSLPSSSGSSLSTYSSLAEYNKRRSVKAKSKPSKCNILSIIRAIIRKGPLTALFKQENCRDLSEQSLKTTVVTSIRKNNKFLLHVKVLLFFYQIASNLPNALYFSFPQYSSWLLSIYSFLSLSNIKVIYWDCSTANIFSDINFSYVHYLVITTILPVVILTVLMLVAFLTNEILLLEDYSRFRRSMKQFCYMQKILTGLLFFQDLFAFQVLQYAFGSYLCVTIANSEMSTIPSINSQYFHTLWNDMSLTCSNDNTIYLGGVVWASLSVVVYLLIIPVVEGLVLWTFSKRIDGFASASQKTASGYLSMTQSNPNRRKRKEMLTLGSFFRSSFQLNHGVDGTALQELITSEVEDEYLNKLNKTKLHLINEFRCLLSDHLSFFYLFQSYRTGYFKYTEFFLQLVKLFYIAILPLVFTQSRLSKIIVATIAGIVLLWIFIKSKPFASKQHQLLFELELFAISLTSLIALFIQLDHESVWSVDYETVDVILSIVLLAPTMFFLYQVTLSKPDLQSTPTKEQTDPSQKMSSSTSADSTSFFERQASNDHNRTSLSRVNTTVDEDDVDGAIVGEAGYSRKNMISDRHQRTLSQSYARSTKHSNRYKSVIEDDHSFDEESAVHEVKFTNDMVAVLSDIEEEDGLSNDDDLYSSSQLSRTHSPIKKGSSTLMKPLSMVMRETIESAESKQTEYFPPTGKRFVGNNLEPRLKSSQSIRSMHQTKQSRTDSSPHLLIASSPSRLSQNIQSAIASTKYKQSPRGMVPSAVTNDRWQSSKKGGKVLRKVNSFNIPRGKTQTKASGQVKTEPINSINMLPQQDYESLCSNMSSVRSANRIERHYDNPYYTYYRSRSNSSLLHHDPHQTSLPSAQQSAIPTVSTLTNTNTSLPTTLVVTASGGGKDRSVCFDFPDVYSVESQQFSISKSHERRRARTSIIDASIQRMTLPFPPLTTMTETPPRAPKHPKQRSRDSDRNQSIIDGNPNDSIGSRSLIEDENYQDEAVEDRKALRDSNNTVSYSESAPLHLRDSAETVVSPSQVLVTDVTTNLFNHSDDYDEDEDDDEDEEDEDGGSISPDEYEYDDEESEEVSDLGNGSSSNRSQLELNSSFQYLPLSFQQRQQQSNRIALNSQIQHLLQKYPSPFQLAAAANGQGQYSEYDRDRDGRYNDGDDITPIITVSDDEVDDIEDYDRDCHSNLRGASYGMNRLNHHLGIFQRGDYKARRPVMSDSLDSNNVATTNYNSINYTNLSH